MNWKMAIGTGMLFLAMGGGVTAASVQGEYRGYPVVNVVVNGQAVVGEVPGINLEGTTLVPLRAVSETFGADVAWNGETSTVSLTTATMAQPKKTAEEAYYERVRETYEDVLKELDGLADVRENIRLAKEFYDITKTQSRWFKTYTTYFAKLGEGNSELVSDMQKLVDEANFNGYASKPDLVSTVMASREVLNAYQGAVQSLQFYYDFKQDDMLTLYIHQLSSGFEKEQAAKEVVRQALQSVRDK
jgi:hypothetical protein